jgi:hypothetical protein
LLLAPTRSAEALRGLEPPLLCRSADSGSRRALRLRTEVRCPLPSCCRIRGSFDGFRRATSAAEASESFMRYRQPVSRPRGLVPCLSRTPRCALLAGPAPRPRGRRSGLTDSTGPPAPRCRRADGTASVCRSLRLTSPVLLPPSSHLAMFGWPGSTCDPEGHGSGGSSCFQTPRCPFRRWRRTRLSFDLGGPLPPRSRCRSPVVGSVVAAAPSVNEHLLTAVAPHRNASRCRLARVHRSSSEPLKPEVSVQPAGKPVRCAVHPALHVPGCGLATLPRPCRTEVRWLP